MFANDLVPIDRSRAEQFMLLGSVCRLFDDYDLWTSDKGVTWALQRHGSHGFGFTWLGPSWVFDPHVSEKHAEKLAARRKEMERDNDDNRHIRELDAVLEQIQLGTHCERLLWLIHQAIWSLHRSVFRLPDYFLSTAVWRNEKPPCHWRKNLLYLLKGLSRLHLSEWPSDKETPPEMGAETALVTQVADLREHPDRDICEEDCPGFGGPRHHHYLINVGRGFMGVLEQFAQCDDDTGVRSYVFPREGREAIRQRFGTSASRDIWFPFSCRPSLVNHPFAKFSPLASADYCRRSCGRRRGRRRSRSRSIRWQRSGCFSR